MVLGGNARVYTWPLDMNKLDKVCMFIIYILVASFSFSSEVKETPKTLP